VNGAARFLYHGPNVVQELVNGNATANLPTWGIDEVVLRTSGAGTRAFLTDALGSVAALTDTSATVQTQYTYEPFGATFASGVANDNPSQYTGRENDNTGLYYYRARYNSPALQRFISEDPLECGGGSSNLYAYISNNPMDSTDPFGLRPLTACEKQKLGPFIPQADLDRADVHEDKWPPKIAKFISLGPFLSGDVVGVTLENDIYLRPGAYDPSTPDGLGLLGHELVHVGQYRQDTSRKAYCGELIRHGSGTKNKYEAPAYAKGNDVQTQLSSSNDKYCSR
jgi:RHS repeat-associated protein